MFPSALLRLEKLIFRQTNALHLEHWIFLSLLQALFVPVAVQQMQRLDIDKAEKPHQYGCCVVVNTSNCGPVALSSRLKDSHLLAALDLVQKLRDDIFTDTGVGQRNNTMEPVYFTPDVQ